MRTLQIIVATVLAGVSAADFAQADESQSDAGQVAPDAGADGAATQVAFDTGVDTASVVVADSHSAPSDTGLANMGHEAVHADAGLDADLPPEHSAKSLLVEASSDRGQNVPVVAMRAVSVSSNRLPLLGVMVDVGVPDGIMVSLAARPWNWLRFSAGAGSNAISYGVRAGMSVVPPGSGPSAHLEFGGFQDGDANVLAKRFMGSSFDGNPALERVGYQFMAARVGLDFGSRAFVFFVHGGVTMLRGCHDWEARAAWGQPRWLFAENLGSRS